MVLALVISVLFSGLGLLYTKEYLKGIIIFVVSVIVSIISMKVTNYVGFISIIVWIYGLYCTYKSVNEYNANLE